ncbi:methyltransferase family protein [Arachidicoccus terrestris]|uniref:methyltransferase family protein n=1 Tax=Arachidicoccus terrestris TaxID=2875539 RepID=UPI001CC7DE86|nr:isoprenylcysteine carboxylmethyltransferase family protein [Arachidicoccus terrestris]UAY55414.1 isoprenylcysteine carboxylmethyltransferase family protein [Arachidicoccus terrestris]
MSEYIKIVLRVIWLTVIIYWVLSAFRAKKTTRQESLVKRFALYWLPIIIAILLLGPGNWYGHSWLRENFVAHTNTVGFIGLSFCIVGGAVVCYARYLLGRNWSVSVAQKKQHELIKSGIYSLIRHPIYTGLLLLFTGNALIVGDYRGILAVVIVFVSLWLKLKKEEHLLTGIFGAEYAGYKANTKAIIPYVL